ncbi:MAG TPA: hypothetical protein VF331_15815 [Polyangiales bacterium]
MLRYLQLLHIYAGLQTCIALLIFGVAGLVATWSARPGAVPPAEHTRRVPMRVDGQLNDQQLALRAWQTLHLPLTQPPPDFAISHDRAGDLTFRLYTPNGETQVTVLAREQALRVAAQPADLGHFLLSMHLQTFGPVAQGGSRLLKLWALYIELSIVALGVLGISGLALWLFLRRNERWAQLALGLGSGGFALLYFWMR